MSVSRRSFLSRFGIATVVALDPGVSLDSQLYAESEKRDAAAPFPQIHGDNVVWPDHIMCKLCGSILYPTRNHKTGEMFVEHVKVGTDGSRSRFCKNEGKKFKVAPHAVSSKEV